MRGFPRTAFPKNLASHPIFLLPPQIQSDFNRNCRRGRVCSRRFRTDVNQHSPSHLLPFALASLQNSQNWRARIPPEPPSLWEALGEGTLHQSHPTPGEPRKDQKNKSGTPPTLIPRLGKLPEEGNEPEFPQDEFVLLWVFSHTWEQLPQQDRESQLTSAHPSGLGWDPGWERLGATQLKEGVPIRVALGGTGGPFPPKPGWDCGKGCAPGAPG